MFHEYAEKAYNMVSIASHPVWNKGIYYMCIMHFAEENVCIIKLNLMRLQMGSGGGGRAVRIRFEYCSPFY